MAGIWHRLAGAWARRGRADITGSSQTFSSTDTFSSTATF